MSDVMTTTRNCAYLPLCEHVRDTVPDEIYWACLSDLASASRELATGARGRPQPSFPAIEILERDDSRLPAMSFEPTIDPDRFLMISITDLDSSTETSNCRAHFLNISTSILMMK